MNSRQSLVGLTAGFVISDLLSRLTEPVVYGGLVLVTGLAALVFLAMHQTQGPLGSPGQVVMGGLVGVALGGIIKFAVRMLLG